MERDESPEFLGAASVKEILFVRGTTEAINLAAQTSARSSAARRRDRPVDLEHHANIVPWQMIAREKGAVLRVIPVNDRGEIMLESTRTCSVRTKMVSLTHASNSLGTLLPIVDMIRMAKRYGD